MRLPILLPLIVLAVSLGGCAALSPEKEAARPAEPVVEAFALPWPNPDVAQQMSLREKQRADAIARLELVIDEDDAIRGVDPGLPGRRFDNLWDRIRAGFSMPELDSPLVAQKERFYLERQDYLQRMMQRGGRYLFHIVEEIEKRNMPTELALLPFVESAMNPTAMSPAQASGLWQFIPSTGRAYNLQQDWWVDNRRDVVKSTQAALDYLQKIYEMQGNDWFLALASYNWGEGAVARAIRNNRSRNRPADYLSLSMPNETRQYVPKLIALKNILMRADDLGLALPPLPNRPYFVTIEKTRPIDLSLAAEFAEMTVEEFLELNPAHNRPVIAATRNNEIKLPADRLDGFLNSVERHIASGKPFATWQPYTLKAGETLEAVAARSNIPAAELRRVNGVRPAARLAAGTRLLVPGQPVQDDRRIEDFQGARIVEVTEQRAVWHSVVAGETFASIARRHKVTVAHLRKLNPAVPGEPEKGARVLVRQASQAVVTTENGQRQVVETVRPETPAPATATAAPQPSAPAPQPAARAAAPSAAPSTTPAPATNAAPAAAKAAAPAPAAKAAAPAPAATTPPAAKASTPAPAANTTPPAAKGAAPAPAAKAAPAPAEKAAPAAAAPSPSKPASTSAGQSRPAPAVEDPAKTGPQKASTNPPAKPASPPAPDRST